MPVFVLVFFIFPALLNAATTREPLDRYRLARVAELPEVKKAYGEFVETATKFLAAPAVAKIDKLVPYMKCEDYQRNVNKVGKMGTVDLAEAICAQREVANQEKAILEERETADKIFAKHERAGRVLSLASTTLANWNSDMRELSKIFQSRCGNDRLCLERKQLHRQQQIHRTAVALLSFKFLATQVDGFFLDPERRKSFGKNLEAAVTKTEDSLIGIFRKLQAREDLPW